MCTGRAIHNPQLKGSETGVKQDSSKPDKNLINTVAELSARPVNSQEAQQAQQDHNDRRKRAVKEAHRKPAP
jgi:hypothetical protein